MSMSIFSQAMKEAINIYRGMLRKYLPQAERVTKLHELNLKNPQLYENEIALFHTGYAIISDIKKNLNQSASGYYSYSGVSSFGEHLKEFLQNYEIEGNAVVHRSQKASRAIIQAIQLLTLPKDKLTPEIASRLSRCNDIIAKYGSEDQQDLHKSTLQNTIRKQQQGNTSFYRAVLSNFQQKMHSDNLK